jgi:hypothetical protein
LFELSWLCGFEAGVFDAHGGGGGSTGETRHPLWLGGYLGGGVALAMSASFAVGLRLEGVVALRRPSFVLQSDLGDEYQVHRPGLLAGRGWLELELHFPD